MLKPRRSGVRTAAAAGGLLAALLLSSGCSGSSEAQSSSPPAATPAAKPEAPSAPPEDAIAVEVAEVGRRTLSELYGTSATLRADKRATVTARTRGVIRRLLVEEGDRVAAGQPLARLEDDEQRIAFAQAGSAAETVQREFERARTLHAQGLLADEAFEATRRQAVETKHAAELAELTLSRTVVRAPFGGLVLTRHLDVGATVNDGTAVYDLADVQPLYADVQVPERQVARLAAGQTVRIATDHDGHETTARIERIAPLVDPETGTVKVTIAVPAGGALRPGSFVRVGIVTETHADALVVRRSALVAEGRRWHLFRVVDPATGEVERLEVERGFEEDDVVEIVATLGEATPLRPGDEVVVRGASSLNDDSFVRVMAPEADEPVDENGAAPATT